MPLKPRDSIPKELEILSQFSLSYTSMATNVDQWKWCQICISAVFRNCSGCGQVKWTYLSPSIAPVISSTVFCGMRMPPFFWLQDRQMHYMDVEIGNQASSENLDKTLWMEIDSLTTKCWNSNGEFPGHRRGIMTIMYHKQRQWVSNTFDYAIPYLFD